MKYIILIPAIIGYALWSYHSLKHFFKGDFYDHPDTAFWVAVTFVGYVVIVSSFWM